jgi:hypothetical protein
VKISTNNNFARLATFAGVLSASEDLARSAGLIFEVPRGSFDVRFSSKDSVSRADSTRVMRTREAPRTSHGPYPPPHITTPV